MHSDGVVHPNEQAFRDDVEKLLEVPIALDDAELLSVDGGHVVIGEQQQLTPRVNTHPLLTPSEWDFSDDPQTFATQAAGDVDLMSPCHRNTGGTTHSRYRQARRRKGIC